MKIFKREAVNYTLSMEEGLAEKEKTVFMLKPLSTKQFMQLQDKIDFTNGEDGFKVKNFSSYSYEVVKAVRKVTGKTIITKLSPNVTDIIEIAKASENAGSDAVSLVNTFLGMAIDINTRKPKLGNITGGLSGPCIKPIALRMVYEVSKNINIPVIGAGGIMNADDAVEFMLAGAVAVQVGTANFIDPGVCGKIAKGIEDYLKKHKIDRIQDLGLT